MGDARFYKNPARKDTEEYKLYIPQYQVMGITPTEYKTIPVSEDQPKVVTSEFAPDRNKRIPNVGNNVEQTWASVDGNIVDDLDVEITQKLVDNNEFMTSTALGTIEDEVIKNESHQEKPNFLSYESLQSELNSDNLTSILSQIDYNEYIILVKGEIVCSGSHEFIQEQTQKLVFGEHEFYSNEPITLDDIIVIKKTKIKIGVFLE